MPDERIPQLPANVQVKYVPAAGAVGRRRSVSDEERGRAYLAVLECLKAEFDHAITAIHQVLTNDANEEWLAVVSYRDGQFGAIEGNGRTIVRYTISKELIERLAEVDPELQFQWQTEPRE